MEVLVKFFRNGKVVAQTICDFDEAEQVAFSYAFALECKKGVVVSQDNGYVFFEVVNDEYKEG